MPIARSLVVRLLHITAPFSMCCVTHVRLDWMRMLLGVPCVAWVHPAICTLAALSRHSGLVLSVTQYVFSSPPTK